MVSVSNEPIPDEPVPTRLIIGFAALAVLALITSLMLVRMDQAERANNRPRPRIKTDIPPAIRREFDGEAPDA